MAQIDIKTIEKLEKERNSIHEKVYATYSTFDHDGKHYVQIDTYGKSDRAIPGKISQSIQLDEESANFLLDLLEKEYRWNNKWSRLRVFTNEKESIYLFWLW